MTLQKRLEAVRVHSGLSQAKLSQALGFNRSFWNLVESGKTSITENLIQALDDRFRIDPGWLRTGAGQMFKTASVGFDAGRHQVQITPPDYTRPDHGDLSALGQDFVFVRRFDVDLSAGTGAIQAPGEDHESIAFTTSFMRKLHVNADLCGLVRVKGDSMGRTVPDGSLALIHFAERQVMAEGIYAFSRDDASFIKRLVPLDLNENGHPKKIMILGDGIGQGTETIEGADLFGLRIVGRVRAVITAFD